MSETALESGRIGLALSGGGIRAAVFHLGVLTRLAKAGLLEQVSQISTVSGGSLVTGAIFSQADGKWPTSRQYLHSVLPNIERMLTSGDLFSLSALGISGFVRENWRVGFRRADVLASLLRSRWGCWFPRGTEPVFPPRSEPPLSMVF